MKTMIQRWQKVRARVGMAAAAGVGTALVASNAMAQTAQACTGGNAALDAACNAVGWSGVQTSMTNIGMAFIGVVLVLTGIWVATHFIRKVAGGR